MTTRQLNRIRNAIWWAIGFIGTITITLIISAIMVWVKHHA